jgi:hypothetical protein
MSMILIIKIAKTLILLCVCVCGLPVLRQIEF